MAAVAYPLFWVANRAAELPYRDPLWFLVSVTKQRLLEAAREQLAEE